MVRIITHVDQFRRGMLVSVDGPYGPFIVGRVQERVGPGDTVLRILRYGHDRPDSISLRSTPIATRRYEGPKYVFRPKLRITYLD